MLPVGGSLCILGAGASGLVACATAKRLVVGAARRPAFRRIRVYEQSQLHGGLWNYTKDSGGNPTIYRDLRSNLPTRLMEVPFLPFSNACSGDKRPRSSFVHHHVVLEYLQRLHRQCGLEDHIEYGARVRRVEFISAEADGKRHGRSSTTQFQVHVDGSDAQPEIFDAVLCCTGSFLTPKLPSDVTQLLDNLRSRWPVSVVVFSHSHSQTFDDASEFDQCCLVVVVGCGSSGRDIVGMVAERKHAVVAWVPREKVAERYLHLSTEDDGLSEDGLMKRARIRLHETAEEAVLEHVRQREQEKTLRSGAIHVHLIFATGYKSPTFEYLPQSLRPPEFTNRNESLLAMAQMDPASGFTTRLNSASNLGFVGFLSVTSPLGISYWQSKFFLESLFKTKKELDSDAKSAQARSRSESDKSDAGALQDLAELTFTDLLHCAESQEDARELIRRQRMFEVCEGHIQRNFLTYRERWYDFGSHEGEQDVLTVGSV